MTNTNPENLIPRNVYLRLLDIFATLLTIVLSTVPRKIFHLFLFSKIIEILDVKQSNFYLKIFNNKIKAQ